MENTPSNSDMFSQVNDVKDIQIKHFSSTISGKSEHAHFVRKKNFYGQLYAVHLYQDGISSESQGYVSIKVSKVLKDPDNIPGVGYDNITWTFSVVDINECGRYYQSVAKESIVNLPYQIEIPMFLRKSFVLERADEILPGDILTIRCEASFVFHSVHALYDDLVFDVNPYPENDRFVEDSTHEDSSETDYGIFAEDFEEDYVFSEQKLFEDFEKGVKLNESSETDNAGLTKNLRGHLDHDRSDSDSVTARTDTEDDITYYMLIMLGFLHEYHECKQSRNLNSRDFEFQIRLLSKILANTDGTDEITRTYMCIDPLFKMYIRLKSIVKTILSKNPLRINEEEDLENEKYNYHPLYTQGSYITFSESFFVMKKIADVTKRLGNSSGKYSNKHTLSTDEYKYSLEIVAELSDNNPMWNYLFEAMTLDDPDILNDERDPTDPDCCNETKWNLEIQTKDDVIFNIPFEEGKETFGSKLVASSSVFESMLRNPMKERFTKKVQLSDVDFRTFRNFLQYLQGNGVVTDSFKELCDLYEMADEYNVEDMMFDCGLMFTPFLTGETISIVESLACMHSDDFLLEAIKSSKEGHSNNLTRQDDCDFVIKRSANLCVKERRYDFDFYR